MVRVWLKENILIKFCLILNLSPAYLQKVNFDFLRYMEVQRKTFKNITNFFDLCFIFLLQMLNLLHFTIIGHIVTNDVTNIIYSKVHLTNLTDHYRVACLLSRSSSKSKKPKRKPEY